MIEGIITKQPLLVGWREWAKLPMLDIPLIKVKIDTGAKTSTLHAHDIKIIKDKEGDSVEFTVNPMQQNEMISRKSRAKIVDMRIVKSSNGLTEERVVINSPIQIGQMQWEIDITLTNRDIMNHRMLLGRSAMNNLLVCPTKSYCQGIISKQQTLITYQPITLVTENN